MSLEVPGSRLPVPGSELRGKPNPQPAAPQATEVDLGAVGRGVGSPLATRTSPTLQGSALGGGYTQHHPRWLRPHVSTFWWLGRWPYLKFILRELSSVFVAWFVVFFLLLVAAVGRGDAAYQRFLEWAGHPVVVAVNVIGLAFVVFHAVTWFNLAPQAMAVRFRGRRVGKLWIAAPNYLAWVVASAVVAWLFVG